MRTGRATFRIYDTSDGLTKNTHFRAMLDSGALNAVTADR